jgi:hypothetical protein
MIGVGRIIHRAFLIPQKKNQTGFDFFAQKIPSLHIDIFCKHVIVSLSIKIHITGETPRNQHLAIDGI